MTNKEIKAIKEHHLNPAMFDRTEVKVGSRGGFSIENKWTRKSHPLERFFNAGKITANQKAAGMKLQKWAHMSDVYNPARAINMDRVSGDCLREMSEAQVIAWDSYFKTMKEIKRQCGLATMQAMTQLAVYEQPLKLLDMLPQRGKIKAIAEALQVAHEFNIDVTL